MEIDISDRSRHTKRPHQKRPHQNALVLMRSFFEVETNAIAFIARYCLTLDVQSRLRGRLRDSQSRGFQSWCKHQVVAS